jgi:hypothetical protein
MSKNMGKVDRILRAVIGLMAIGLGIYYQSWWGALGLILLITAKISWCPLYVPLNFSTKKSEAN